MPPPVKISFFTPAGFGFFFLFRTDKLFYKNDKVVTKARRGSSKPRGESMLATASLLEKKRKKKKKRRQKKVRHGKVRKNRRLKIGRRLTLCQIP